MQRGKRVTVLSSQFFRKYLKHGYKGVQRWYREVIQLFIARHKYCSACYDIQTHLLQVNLLKQDMIVMFINHAECHWTLLVWHMHISSNILSTQFSQTHKHLVGVGLATQES